MHQKQNLSSRVRRQKQGLTVTADVSQVLKTINNNTNWKNASSKFTKTINPKTINPKHLIKNVMTEQDLDNLFNKSKQKIKTEAPCQHVEKWGNKTIKDFANSVTFLKMEDQTDRLLTGLPLQSQLDDERINCLFMEHKQDLTAQFKKNYLVGKVIGEGAYASVRVAIYKPINRKIAIKVYQKCKIKDSQRKKSVRRQIRILQMLSHQNIVKIHDVVQTNHHLNIIMEYLSGISLNAYLKMQPGNRATEKNSRKIIKALTEALKYLHEKQISHRDIKLQNIILDQSISPKMIDFGFSTCIEKQKKVKIFCGTPSYMAPEIVQKKQHRGEPADIWALGVLFFVTLTGIFPFKGATDQELYKKINNSEYPKGQLVFSREVSDLISKMLRINPDERITAQEILQHPWMGAQPLSYKKYKKTQLSGDCKKRTTISSHKSKQKQREDNIPNNRKLTETCKQNLKIQLKMMRQSPAKLDNTYTQRKMGKELLKALRGQKGILGSINTKKQNNNKSNSKVLDLLRIQMKRRQDNKSKGKTRKI